MPFPLLPFVVLFLAHLPKKSAYSNNQNRIPYMTCYKCVVLLVHPRTHTFVQSQDLGCVSAQNVAYNLPILLHPPHKFSVFPLCCRFAGSLGQRQSPPPCDTRLTCATYVGGAESMAVIQTMWTSCVLNVLGFRQPRPAGSRLHLLAPPLHGPRDRQGSGLVGEAPDLRGNRPDRAHPAG